jgi:hypothetical protein
MALHTDINEVVDVTYVEVLVHAKKENIGQDSEYHQRS